MSSYNVAIPLNGAGVRYLILKKGMETTEAAACFWGNLTQSIQDSTKGLVTMDSGKRAAVGTFKATKDFGRGDVLCGSLCSVSTGCEVVSRLVWCTIPGKITTVAVLKATSIGCQKFKDLCVQDPSSPLC